MLVIVYLLPVALSAMICLLSSISCPFPSKARHKNRQCPNYMYSHNELTSDCKTMGAGASSNARGADTRQIPASHDRTTYGRPPTDPGVGSRTMPLTMEKHCRVFFVCNRKSSLLPTCDVNRSEASCRATPHSADAAHICHLLQLHRAARSTGGCVRYQVQYCGLSGTRGLCLREVARCSRSASS